MVDKVYSDEELSKMRGIEHMMQLYGMKEGRLITKRNIDALNHFFGGTFDTISKIPMTSSTIKFTKEGAPYTTDGNPLGISVNGKDLPNLVEGENHE